MFKDQHDYVNFFQSDDEEDEEKKALKQHTKQNEELVPVDDKDDSVVSRNISKL